MHKILSGLHTVALHNMHELSRRINGCFISLWVVSWTTGRIFKVHKLKEMFLSVILCACIWPYICTVHLSFSSREGTIHTTIKQSEER